MLNEDDIDTYITYPPKENSESSPKAAACPGIKNLPVPLNTQEEECTEDVPDHQAI